MLVAEGHGGLVAYFCGTEVLDGTGIHVACLNCPLVALGGKFEEGRSVKAHEGFLDYGLELVVCGVPCSSSW